MNGKRPQQLTDLSQADRFQVLIDAVKDYAIYLLDAQGQVTTWNTGAQRFKGYTPDEIIGQHFSVFYTDEDRAIGSSAITAVRQTGAAAGSAISGVAANLAGFTGGITAHNGQAISFWVFVSVIPLALAGTWAAFRLTGSAETA